MAPGARSKFSAPTFENEVFRKQIYCIEESTCDIVGTFRRPLQTFGAPHSDSAPGDLRPPFPLITPPARNGAELKAHLALERNTQIHEKSVSIDMWM